MAIVQGFEESKVDYAVCGGLALAIHGFSRMTKDIDLLVRRKDVPKAKSALARLGYTPEASPMTFRKGTENETRVHRVSKIRDDQFLTVDLIEVEPKLRHIWKERDRFELRGREVKSISRDGLIEMKTRAGRPQDLVDIQRLEEDNP